MSARDVFDPGPRIGYRRVEPLLVQSLVEYVVLVDGVEVGRVHGWDVTRQGTGRWPGRRVTERVWAPVNSAGYQYRSRGAAAKHLIDNREEVRP